MKKSLKCASIVATALLAVAPVLTPTISVNINTVEAARRIRRNYHRKDSSRYKVHVIANMDLNLDTQKISNIKPKSLITNWRSLPKGTKVRWAYGHKPRLSDRGLTHTVSCITQIVFPDHSKDLEETRVHLYGTNHIKLPDGYTLEALTKADGDYRDNSIPKSFIKILNKANPVFYPESRKDQQEKVDFYNLTPAQQKTLSQYAVRLVNEVRHQLGTTPVSTNAEVQKTANKIQAQYTKDHWNYQWMVHDPTAIIPLTQNGGTEDLGGSFTSRPRTISDMKKLIFNALTSMLFNTTELHHAGNIVGDDPDINPLNLALSYNYSKSWDSPTYYVHFIFTK